MIFKFYLCNRAGRGLIEADPLDVTMMEMDLDIYWIKYF